MLNSVANALRVLEYLVEKEEAGVSEIGRELDITVGTVYRLVATLVGAGFAEQNPGNRRYRPGAKLLTLANEMRSQENVRQVVHEHLARLTERVDETTNLAVLSEDMILYIDKVTTSQPFGIEARVGSRLPAYCTALGKVLTAGLDQASFDGYLQRLPELAVDQGHPVPPPDRLRSELERVRRYGVAEDHGEYLPDVFCAAAPVRNGDDRVVAAISISAPRSRFHDKRDELVAEVVAAAAELSADLKRLGARDVTA
jgi:DNA-binding IclR family transcriptional regulator